MPQRDPVGHLRIVPGPRAITRRVQDLRGGQNRIGGRTNRPREPEIDSLRAREATEAIFRAQIDARPGEHRDVRRLGPRLREEMRSRAFPQFSAAPVTPGDWRAMCRCTHAGIHHTRARTCPGVQRIRGRSVLRITRQQRISTSETQPSAKIPLRSLCRHKRQWYLCRMADIGHSAASKQTFPGETAAGAAFTSILRVV